jgi:hypothetical protein
MDYSPLALNKSDGVEQCRPQFMVRPFDKAEMLVQ